MNKPPLTDEQFKRYFPNCKSEDFRRLNTVPSAAPVPEQPPAPGDQGGDPKPEPRPGKKPKGEIRTPAPHPGKYLLRIESRRVRLTDEDNLCPKYHIDALRYAFVIPDDTPDTVKLSISQVKVESREEEITRMSIYPPGQWPTDL